MKDQLSKDIKDHLAADILQIAITTDILTSLTNEAYSSFTASYINTDLDHAFASPNNSTSKGASHSDHHCRESEQGGQRFG